MSDPKTIHYLGGEIRLDEHGQADDNVFGGPGAQPPVVHLERLDSGLWWLGLTPSDGTRDGLRFHFWSPTPIHATIESDDEAGTVSVGFGLPARRGWVELGEQLPEHAQVVAIVRVREDDGERAMRIAVYDDVSTAFVSMWPGRIYGASEVTHWCDPADLLPEPLPNA